jgi:hypothetical protein
MEACVKIPSIFQKKIDGNFQQIFLAKVNIISLIAVCGADCLLFVSSGRT